MRSGANMKKTMRIESSFIGDPLHALPHAEIAENEYTGTS
jgi:hypothetical protein